MEGAVTAAGTLGETRRHSFTTLANCSRCCFFPPWKRDDSLVCHHRETGLEGTCRRHKREHSVVGMGHDLLDVAFPERRCYVDDPAVCGNLDFLRPVINQSLGQFVIYQYGWNVSDSGMGQKFLVNAVQPLDNRPCVLGWGSRGGHKGTPMQRRIGLPARAANTRIERQEDESPAINDGRTSGGLS